MEISYQVAPDDVVAFNIHVTETAPGLRMLMLAVTAIVAIALSWMVAVGTSSTPVGVAAGVVGGMLYLLTAPRLLRASVAAIVRRRLRSARSPLLGDHSMEITPDALIGTTRGAGSQTLLAAIRRVERHDERTFIYVTDDSAFILPRAGVTDGDYDAFVDALQLAATAARN